MPEHNDLHAVATLLPWYVNNTLGDAERQEVERHLPSCTSCRSELAELAQLREQLRAAQATETDPSSQVFLATMRRIREEQSAREGSRGTTQPTGGILEAVQNWIGQLFVPSWVPTVAVTLIVVQMAALVWLVSTRTPGGRIPYDDRQEVMSRGLPGSTTRLRVVFHPEVSIQEIRALLQEIRAQIVKGPSADGAYEVELKAMEPAAIIEKLEKLRSRKEVVVTVEYSTP